MKNQGEAAVGSALSYCPSRTGASIADDDGPYPGSSERGSAAVINSGKIFKIGDSAGSWIYFGTQGILQGERLTFAVGLKLSLSRSIGQ